MNTLGAGERKGWPEVQPRPRISSVDSKLDDLFGKRATKSAPEKPPELRTDLLDLLSESIANDKEMSEQRQRVRNQEAFDQERFAAALRDTKTDDYKDHELTLRLKPALGRTVNLLNLPGGKDLTRAFRQLEMRCQANSIRQEEREQRTHVRRGQRRKIERMRRWRILFKEGFIAECARIRRMKKQGW